jgi:hypothetical protein
MTVREIQGFLREQYPGGKNWRKKKGFPLVYYIDTGETERAEIHWYEAHGIGKVELKIK